MAHQEGHVETHQGPHTRPAWWYWINARFRTGDHQVIPREVNGHKALVRAKLEPLWWNLRRELCGADGVYTPWGAVQLINRVLYELAGKPEDPNDYFLEQPRGTDAAEVDRP